MDEDELYAVPRDRFVAERGAWVKALRAAGRREQATEVAALRKPSVAAAEVNRLVRSEPDRFGTLVAAGDALRQAQDRMLSGDGTGEELRRAVEDERAAVEALLASGAEPGMSAAVRDRVAGTLHAAALDDDAREQVRRGRLVEELQHVGFGATSSTAASPPPPRRRTRSDADTERPTRRDCVEDASESSRVEARRVAERERERQRRLTEERKRARHAEREAGRRLQTAERALAHAEERQATARAALEQAEERLDAARAEVEAASAAHGAAQRAVQSLR